MVLEILDHHTMTAVTATEVEVVLCATAPPAGRRHKGLATVVIGPRLLGRSE